MALYSLVVWPCVCPHYRRAGAINLRCCMIRRHNTIARHGVVATRCIDTNHVCNIVCACMYETQHTTKQTTRSVLLSATAPAWCGRK